MNLAGLGLLIPLLPLVLAPLALILAVWAERRRRVRGRPHRAAPRG